jgi:Methylenetetrahydrofolate reductase
MRGDRILAEERPMFSFEFFRRKTDETRRTLEGTLEVLKDDRPDDVSVTYGAGGTTGERTVMHDGCATSNLVWGTGAGPKWHGGVRGTTHRRQTPLSGARDTRGMIPLLRAMHRQRRFAGTSHAGGGTRTPDTRIMIPLL